MLVGALIARQELCRKQSAGRTLDQNQTTVCCCYVEHQWKHFWGHQNPQTFRFSAGFVWPRALSHLHLRLYFFFYSFNVHVSLLFTFIPVCLNEASCCVFFPRLLNFLIISVHLCSNESWHPNWHDCTDYTRHFNIFKYFTVFPKQHEGELG